MTDELYIGLMSGTSANAMDGVLVDFSQKPPKVLTSDSIPFEENIRARIFSFNYAPSCTLEQLFDLDTAITSIAAQLVAQILKKANLAKKRVRAICFSGQTIAHKPNKGFSLQAGNPNVLAEKSGIDVVADLRQRDLAAGGQGAPLAAAFHHEFFTRSQEDRAIVNIGGIANLTQLHQDSPVVGFDTGPGNCLLDEWARKHIGKNYDKNGDWARSGTPIAELLDSLLQDGYFSQSPPKTSGRDYFNMDWLSNYLQQCERQYLPEDVQATLVDLTVLSISLSVYSELNEKSAIYLCGGGVKNSYLCERIRQLSRCSVCTTKDLGLEPLLVEAISFAWLGYRRIHQKSGNIPSVTGAKGERILGGIYKGTKESP